MASTRACIFCGGRPVTREHVWADWVSQELSKLTPERFNVSLRAGGETLRWRDINVGVKRFCKTCNGGWMSDIESETALILRRMMLGKEPSIHLSPEDQIILARWAYKTALALDFVLLTKDDSPDKPPPIPEKTYHDFYRDRIPPNVGCSVWTTAYGDSPYAVFSRRYTLPSIGVASDGKDVPGTEVISFLTTFTVFRAVFQIHGHLQGDWLPTKTTPENNRFLIRLWPPTGESVNWPRDGLALNNSGLEVLSKRTDFA